MKSPFKFLDAFTREDRAIFFGRDREIEEMYQKVFESKILLIYGISGTGKTSLINCGLANKFEDTDWLPVNVRRGANIIDSLWKELGKVAITSFGGKKERGGEGARGRGGEGTKEREGERAKGRMREGVKEGKSEWENEGGSEGGKERMGEGMGMGVRVSKALQSIYLDHFKPIYLIFDQFEELFIFGNREEREEFVQIVKAVIDSDVQCKFIFSIREEYLAGVTEFELTIHDFLSNRIRIEKMTHQHAIEVIEGPCKVQGIEVEEGFAEALLDKLNPEGKEVELTYLQVFLDKVYKLALDEQRGGDSSPRLKSGLGMTQSLLGKIGDVSDLLGSFLEEQVNELDDPDTGLTILKAFVSIKGTKRQITDEEVAEFSKTLGKPVEQKNLTELIQRFVNLRILRDKDENNRYELRHDSLAAKIYEKITLVEKELLEVRQFIEDAYRTYERRKILLSDKDLKYLQVYEGRLFLDGKLKEFVELSKKIIHAKRKQFNTILRISLIGFILLLVGIGYYYYRSVSDFRKFERATKSLLQSRQVPGLSFRTAVEAYRMDTTSSVAHFAILNSFYSLLDKGKYYDSINKTFYDPYKLIFDFEPCHADILSATFSKDGQLIYGWLDDNTVKVWNNHGRELNNITGKEDSIITVTLSDNNEFIAIVYEDSTGMVCHINGEKLFDFTVAINPVYNKKVVDFSPNGKFLAVAGLKHDIILYELNGNLFQHLTGHSGRINYLSFSPDRRFIASASDDKTVILWNYNRNTSLFGPYDTIRGHWEPVRSCNFSHNSNYILTAADDSTVAIWNLNGERIFRHSLSDWTSMKFPHEKVCNAEFTEDEELIVITRYHSINNDPAEKNKIATNVKYEFTQTLIHENNYYFEYINPSKNKMVWEEVNRYYDLDKEVRFLEYNNKDGNIAIVPAADKTQIILMSYDLLPLKFFKGTLPVYSLAGDYLLCINGVELYLYPVSVSEIVRLTEEVQIFGRFNYDPMDWVHAF